MDIDDTLERDAQDLLDMAIRIIDASLGEGYAKKNPQLLAQVMDSLCCIRFAAS